MDINNTPVHSYSFSNAMNDMFDVNSIPEAAFVGAGVVFGSMVGADIGAAIGLGIGVLTGNPLAPVVGAELGKWVGAGAGAWVSSGSVTVMHHYIDGRAQYLGDDGVIHLSSHVTNANASSTTWNYTTSNGFAVSYYETNTQVCARINVTGTSHNDGIVGCDVPNTFYGGTGDDQLWGYGGNDILHPGGDNDIVHGGAGNDTIYGEGGADQLWGESGNDTFILNGSDRVFDFDARYDHATGSGTGSNWIITKYNSFTVKDGFIDYDLAEIKSKDNGDVIDFVPHTAILHHNMSFTQAQSDAEILHLLA